MLYIHAWSKTMDNVYEVVKHLNSNVKIVSAKLFFEEISKNLYKGKDGII